MYSVFIADKDRENIQTLVRLFQKNYGINPAVWQNRNGLRTFLRNLQNGAVLIRIDDPSIPGLELTSQVLEFYPKVQLVWMAKSDSHALAAFSHGVEAYLLLPVSGENLEKIIRSLEMKRTV